MKTEERGVSRRMFLATAGIAVASFEIARLPGNVAQAAEALPSLPWPYPGSGLNVDQLRRTAYANHKTIYPGCGFCTSQTLIQAIGDALDGEGASSNPWRLLPSGLYRFANAGVLGWGTICGALNGAIAVMTLLGKQNAVGEALLDYFSNVELPTNALVGWTPPGASAPLTAIPATVSRSPLCHISASTWAAAAGVPVSDPLKAERCVRLVADVVAKSAELLNLSFSGGSVLAWKAPPGYAECYGCHTTAGMVPSEQGKMDCLECHDAVPSHTYRRKRNGR
jgi:hypothetical protein